MQKMNCQAIGYGYIIIPKALLKEQLTGCSPHEGEIEAFPYYGSALRFKRFFSTDIFH